MPQQVPRVDCGAGGFVRTSGAEDGTIEGIRTHAGRSTDPSVTGDDVRGTMTPV